MGDATSILARYPYLSVCLFVTGLFLTALGLAPGHRRVALINAGISTPTAAYALLLVPAYWDPVVITRLPVAVEDLLFMFSSGGLVWLMTAIGSPSLEVRIRGTTIARRWLAVHAIVVPLLLASVHAGIGVVRAGALAGAVLLAVLLWRVPGYWRLAVRGAIAFGTFYTALLWGFFRVWPEAISQWNPAAVSGLVVLGAPVEEIVYGVAYGALLPVFMAYLLDARFMSEEQAEPGRYPAAQSA